MIKLLESLHQQQTIVMPAMELLRMFYYPQSRAHTESMTVQMCVPGIGDIEFKEVCLSESTKHTIESDCIKTMQRRIGL